MKIAFYSTGGIDPASPFSSRHFLFPGKNGEWDALAVGRSEDSIAVYCTGSATHMIDIAGGELRGTSERVPYHILPTSASIEEFADRIAGDGVEVAIAYSLPDVTFDWYPVRDALVGEALAKRGVRVIAHPALSAEICLEKMTFQKVLKENGFLYAEGVYVHSGMFYSDRRIERIRNNVYQEYIRSRLEQLKYPVIIKEAAGSGSVGLKIAATPEEAFQKLLDADGDCDVMVEEKLEGESFGIEMYGDPEGYYVADPILFSTGEDGVTDPFNSIKYGPVCDAAHHVEELKEELKRLGRVLGLSGIAEMDLIFSSGKWYILEVNPRFSLLSQAVSIMEGWNPFEPLVETMLPPAKRHFRPMEGKCHVLDFKSGPFPDEKIREIREKFPGIRHVMRFLYGLPGGGEVSYCEWVLSGADNRELLEKLTALKTAYPKVVSDAVTCNTKQLIRKLTEEEV